MVSFTVSVLNLRQLFFVNNKVLFIGTLQTMPSIPPLFSLNIPTTATTTTTDKQATDGNKSKNKFSEQNPA